MDPAVYIIVGLTGLAFVIAIYNIFRGNST